MLKYEIIRDPEYIILKKVIDISLDSENKYCSILTLEDNTKHSIYNNYSYPICVGDMVAYVLASDQLQKIDIDKLIASNKVRLIE